MKPKHYAWAGLGLLILTVLAAAKEPWWVITISFVTATLTLAASSYRLGAEAMVKALTTFLEEESKQEQPPPPTEEEVNDFMASLFSGLDKPKDI